MSRGDDPVVSGLPNGSNPQPGLTKAAVERAKHEEIIREHLEVSTHTVRHTCATRLAAVGVPINTVTAAPGGHSNLSTTAVYLHNQTDLGPAWQKITDEEAAA